MPDFKLKMKSSRGNSGIAQVSPKKCTTFRTILKPRNDTILTENINVNPSLQKSSVKITQHIKSQSQICLNDEQDISQLPVLLKDSRLSAKNGSIKQSKIVTPLKSMIESQSIDGEKSPSRIRQNKILQQLQQQLMLEEDKDTMSIEGLQKKMDLLINTNLERIRNQKNKLGLSNDEKVNHQAAFNQQFEDMISFMSKTNLLQGEDRSSIKNINKKIEILQKMIAIQTVESETLKNKYLGWKNQKINISSNSKNKNNPAKTNQSDILEKGRQNTQIKSVQMVGNYTSITKLSYNKPSKEYYAKAKKSQNTYTANRKFIPPSSYSSEFLNFGSIPNYCYKSNLQKPLVKVPLAVTVSSYQQQYKDKLKLMSQSIDFKELDSYHDKIKNSKMPFINLRSLEITEKKRKQIKKRHHHQISSENIKCTGFVVKNQQRQKQNHLQSLPISQHFYKSEQNRQFKWPNSYPAQSGVNLLRSEIKHHKLQKMKIDLKAMTMRC